MRSSSFTRDIGCRELLGERKWCLTLSDVNMPGCFLSWTRCPSRNGSLLAVRAVWAMPFTASAALASEEELRWDVDVP